eukprot:6490509-Amphidinium_carterae.1
MREDSLFFQPTEKVRVCTSGVLPLGSPCGSIGCLLPCGLHSLRRCVDERRQGRAAKDRPCSWRAGCRRGPRGPKAHPSCPSL